jgi:hypothetical protein
MLSQSHILLPALLYAETHFRFFRFFPSLIYKKEPEIIFDLPRRLEPGYDLPVILIINDIDRFPVECISVDITISGPSKKTQLFQFQNIKKYIITHPFPSQSVIYLFTIPRNKLADGNNFINCTATIKKQKKNIKILNDNLFGSSKLSFSCFLADCSLPGHNFASYGDLHVHSQYSQSHVEFGAPVSVIDLFSKSYGIDFVAITDHSYDLACSMENYLKPDDQLKRWVSISEEISNPAELDKSLYAGIIYANRVDNSATVTKNIKNTLVLGEEISCLNSKRKAVHLCGIGLKNFIYGTLDGARKNNKMKNQLTIESSIAQIHDQQGVAFAAHPGSKAKWLQQVFLNRGTWKTCDISLKLDGVQAINNGFDKSWDSAKKLWIKELLKGHKLSLAAGNDSHGDFNRYRYLAIPFISIKELFNRYFANSITGIYSKISSQHDVVKGLKDGKTFVTTGPFLNISFSSKPCESIISNKEIDISNATISISLISTCEFGYPFSVELYCGDYKKQKETEIFRKVFNDKNLSVSEEIPTADFPEHGYLRAEAKCKNNDKLNYSATSPCYFSCNKIT